MHLRRLAVTVGLALMALGTTACDGAQGREPGSTGTPAIPVPSSSPTVSGDVLDCGTEEQVHGEGRDEVARQCIADAAAAGRAATFTSAMTTIEGDPLVWTVSVLSSGEVEAVLDNIADRFSAASDRGVHTFRCTSLALTDAGLPLTLELSGCDGETGGSIAI